MHLEEMKKEIGKLVLKKRFYNKPEDIRRSCSSPSSSLVKQVTRGRRVKVKRN